MLLSGHVQGYNDLPSPVKAKQIDGDSWKHQEITCNG